MLNSNGAGLAIKNPGRLTPAKYPLNCEMTPSPFSFYSFLSGALGEGCPDSPQESFKAVLCFVRVFDQRNIENANDLVRLMSTPRSSGALGSFCHLSIQYEEC